MTLLILWSTTILSLLNCSTLNDSLTAKHRFFNLNLAFEYFWYLAGIPVKKRVLLELECTRVLLITTNAHYPMVIAKDFSNYKIMNSCCYLTTVKKKNSCYNIGAQKKLLSDPQVSRDNFYLTPLKGLAIIKFQC